MKPITVFNTHIKSKDVFSNQVKSNQYSYAMSKAMLFSIAMETRLNEHVPEGLKGHSP